MSRQEDRERKVAGWLEHMQLEGLWGSAKRLCARPWPLALPL